MPAAPVLPAPLPQVPSSPSVAEADKDGSNLPLYLALAALVVAIGAFAAWRLRGRFLAPARHAVPVVERPRLTGTAPKEREADAIVPATPSAPIAASAPDSAAIPAASAEPQGPIAIDLAPVRLSMTLVNAALSWRLALTNTGADPLDGVMVELDMISAHKDLSAAEGSGGPAPGGERHELGRMEPGETRTIRGDLRLPFPSIRPMWQGNVALMLPLVRMRIGATGVAPVTRAVLVGQPSPRNTTTLQPFRLDLGPRNYPELASRDLASLDLTRRDLA